MVLVAALAPAVVLARDVGRQALLASVLGLALTVLFLVLQAPDVALSELVVSAVAFPLLVLVANAKVREREER